MTSTMLIRGGSIYRPAALAGKYMLGVANTTLGKFGQSKRIKTENRIYREALIPQRVGEKLLLEHRLRFEQCWVNGQDFRTRFRYALSANVLLNRPDLSPGAVYLALHTEVFINGQRDIGGGREVDLYDRNPFYAALDY